ncbi:MAG TPA: sulfur carrier protein ThiS [Nevskiaceae bacterium]|nr:sulfur carrier protein ThiS [Nevskiaceae bacterium]
MNLIVNGEARLLPPGTSVQMLMAELGLAGKRAAVERNGEIVPRSLYAQTTLAEGDRIEIVQAIGGG